jgi:ABC-type polysaccharide/polyol phosphate transport system ATPase subunit
MRSEAASNLPELSVSAAGLGKHYRLGQLRSLKQTSERLLRRHTEPRPGLEALRDVDFSVFRGEAMGIVGTNGSGKSTMLQILAGTTLPTTGVMRVRGRVLPLLAVGLGFHPDLTGRENVTLFASSLRIPRRTIEARMDSVTAFAELERHMDTPIKRFSSGMVSRLSFAIAVQFPADIYIFDEVLAVVDGEFRDRCLGEIKRLHAEGRTIFFVSHSLDQVAEICHRVMWFDRGTLKQTGPTRDLLSEYERALAAHQTSPPA